MLDRFTRLAILGLLIIVAMLLAEPYLDRYFSSGEPREVRPRAELASTRR